MRKRCSKCGVEKDLSEYHKEKTGRDGFRNDCKACRKQNYQANREAALKRKKQYYQDNREAVLEYDKQYRKNNPEVSRKNERRRRAMKKGIQENYTKQDEFYTRQLFAHMCFRCKATDNLQIDHHYPLSKGHALERDNAVLLCKSCNSSKHNKMPEEFYTESELVQLDYMLCF